MSPNVLPLGIFVDDIVLAAEREVTIVFGASWSFPSVASRK